MYRHEPSLDEEKANLILYIKAEAFLAIKEVMPR